jgi:hypothetical protein
MPAAPADGMVITVESTQIITALTLSPNTGQSIVGVPATLFANQPLSYVYRLSNTTWYPFSVARSAVLQVVSAIKTDTFSTATTGSWVDVTGLSVSITPSNTTSKILVFYNISGMNNTNQGWYSLFRGSTQISVGDASGSRLQASGGNFYDGNASALKQFGSTFLDSPATTSATTYKLAVRSQSATTYVNRSSFYDNTTDHATAVSAITVMEIAA